MAIDYGGKVAVVTGGAGGIGRGLVHALLARGARVVVADVESPALATAVDQLDVLGPVRGRQTDVADPASVRPWPTTSTTPKAAATSSSPTPGSPRAAAACPGSRRSTTGAGASRSTSSAWRQTVLTFLAADAGGGDAGRDHRHLVG